MTDGFSVTESFEQVINDIEMSMLKRFETLRNMIREQQKLLEDVFSGDADRGTAAVLELERKRIAEDRLHEKTQVHTVMQQLTEAWLRLESEGNATQPPPTAPPKILQKVSPKETVRETAAIGEGADGGESWIWYEGETPTVTPESSPEIIPQLPESSSDRLPSTCSVGHDPSQATDLFFKLRSDLRKYAGLT